MESKDRARDKDGKTVGDSAETREKSGKMIERAFFLTVLGGFAAGCVYTLRSPDAGTSEMLPPLCFGGACELREEGENLRSVAAFLLASSFGVLRLPLAAFLSGFTVFALPVCASELIYLSFFFGRYCFGSDAEVIRAVFGAAMMWLSLRICAEAAVYREQTADLPSGGLSFSSPGIPGTAGAVHSAAVEYAVRFLLLAASVIALNTAAAFLPM